MSIWQCGGASFLIMSSVLKCKLVDTAIYIELILAYILIMHVLTMMCSCRFFVFTNLLISNMFYFKLCNFSLYLLLQKKKRTLFTLFFNAIYLGHHIYTHFQRSLLLTGQPPEAMSGDVHSLNIPVNLRPAAMHNQIRVLMMVGEKSER